MPIRHEHMYQQTPTIRRRPDFFDIHVMVEEREIKRPLYLPAELPGFSLFLSQRQNSPGRSGSRPARGYSRWTSVSPAKPAVTNERSPRLVAAPLVAAVNLSIWKNDERHLAAGEIRRRAG